MTEMEFLKAFGDLTSSDTPGSLLIIIGAIVFLFWEVKRIKKIVSNGLSDKVATTEAAVKRIEGYLEGSRKRDNE